MSTRRQQPFLKKLDAATTKKDCGVYIYEDYLSPKEAKETFDLLVDDAKFPWDTKPYSHGERLKQHAYNHDATDFTKALKKKGGKIKNTSTFEGLLKLEELRHKIEKEFDVEVPSVWCNRFRKLNHKSDWHKDIYGLHICVLTLGSKRRIEFRDDKTRQIDTFTPSHGDLYLMPLKVNKTHMHKVCSAMETNPSEQNKGDRLSFVFYFDAPKYAKDFKISRKDKILGYLGDMLA